MRQQIFLAAILALFNPARAEVQYLNSAGPYGTLVAPKSVTADTRGNSYVLDANGVHRFDRAGQHAGMFGEGGRADFRQGTTQAIAVSQERLFLVDQRGVRYEYELGGQPRGTSSPGDHFFHDNLGRLFVFDPATHRIAVSGAGFELVSKLNEMPDSFLAPKAAVVRGSGVLYVADAEARRVLSFDIQGHHVDRLRSQFHNPRGLAVSGDLLFVLDDLSDQIDAAFVKVFDSEDRLIAEFGRPGAEVPKTGRVDFAAAIAANDQFLFICDQAANRVVRVPVSVFRGGEPEPGVIYYRVNRQRITTSDEQYRIKVGGTIGPNNTSRIEGVTLGATRTPRFQLNTSMTIQNTGNVAIKNPRLVVRGGPDWFSGRDMAEQITRGAHTDEEKAFASWNFVRKNMLPGVSWPDYFDAPGKDRSVTQFFNAFGSGACGSYHWLLPRVAMLGGLKAASGQLSDGSHGVAQIEYDGKGHYFDSLLVHSTDRRTAIGLFFRELENRTVASYEDLVHDHYLANRAGENVGMLANLFGYHDGWDPFRNDYTDPADMGMLLRPGESITRRWDYLGQFVGKETPTDAIANGEILYRPRLADCSYRKYAVSEAGVACTADDGVKPSLHPTLNNNREAVTVFKVTSPYPIVGGRVSAIFKRTGENDRLRVGVSYDGHQWFPLWQMQTVGTARETLGFSHLEGLRRLPLHYELYIRVQLGTSGAIDWVGVDDLAIQAVFQSYAPSLPALDVGINEIRYIDATTEAHEVTVERRWKESSIATSPGAAAAPVFPANNARHHGFEFVFKWTAAPAGNSPIDAYEFFLSDRKDMAWPLAPNFETYSGSALPELRVPESSYFSAGVTYYWKVRAVDERGVRGPWSDVWSFQVDGPGRPLALKQLVDGRKIRISWKPNPEGTAPVRYEVYASDERGFMPSDRPHLVTDRSYGPDGKYPTLPSNLLSSTTQQGMIVVDEANPNPLANRSYYRVRAVDAAGVRGAPSEYVEIAHPFVYSAPQVQAKAGSPYAYHLKTTWSIGDPQWNRVPPKPQGASFIYADTLAFALLRAPPWLSIDKSKAIIQGTPPASEAGSHDVWVEVTAYDTSRDAGPKIRSKAEQRFVLEVRP